MRWRVARLDEVRDETATARTLALNVEGWPGHLPGQHVDLRLTAPDGYSTQRSYSIASAVAGDRIALTVQELPDGEVSPYLAREFSIGDEIELRGPLGGWFVWHADDPAPVLLLAGGSGLVPLMAMVRTHATMASPAPFRLLYSVRSPAEVLYADELRARPRDDDGLDVAQIYTRTAPPGSSRPARRIGADDIGTCGWAADLRPLCFVCGPTGFVEAAADLLVELGHDSDRIRTERFGPSGG